MALLFQELKDGIQLGKDLDTCKMCEQQAKKNDIRLKEGLLRNREVFILNINGIRHCYCMDHFKSLLGNYTLVDKNEYESTQHLLGSVLEEETEEQLDEALVKEKEKKNAKTTKTAKSSDGK